MTPPLHDRRVERIALGAVLEGERMNRNVPARAFFVPEHRWLWAHFLEERRDGTPDVRTARAALFLHVLTGSAPESFVDLLYELRTAYLSTPVHECVGAAERVAELGWLRRADSWLLEVRAQVRAGELSKPRLQRMLAGAAR